MLTVSWLKVRHLMTMSLLWVWPEVHLADDASVDPGNGSCFRSPYQQRTRLQLLEIGDVASWTGRVEVVMLLSPFRAWYVPCSPLESSSASITYGVASRTYVLHLLLHLEQRERLRQQREDLVLYEWNQP